MSAASTTTVHLDVAVYKGEPLDWSEYRHTGLHFDFGDGSPFLFVHVEGSAQMFQYSELTSYDPQKSARLVRLVNVGYLLKDASRAQIQHLMRLVPVDNSEKSWNCQHWVGSALERLRDAGRLSSDDCEAGLDGMVTAIAGAQGT